MTLFDVAPDLPSEVTPLQRASSLAGLLRLPGLGPVKVLALARAFHDWRSVQAASERTLRIVAGTAGAALRDAAWPGVPPLPDDVVALGFFDLGYPARLRDLPQPPPVVYLRGSHLKQIFADASVAVVGTREPDADGARVVADYLDDRRGATVVSGLALGVDALAHRHALRTGAQTVVVLGSGVDNPTPVENRDLAVAVLAAGGLLAAEVPPGTAPSARTLVARNRLIAALADEVMLAQAGAPSGSLHTAAAAVTLNRSLLAGQPPAEAVKGWEGNRLLLGEEPGPSVDRSKLPAALRAPGRPVASPWPPQ